MRPREKGMISWEENSLELAKENIIIIMDAQYISYYSQPKNLPEVI